VVLKEMNCTGHVPASVDVHGVNEALLSCIHESSRVESVHPSPVLCFIREKMVDGDYIVGMTTGAMVMIMLVAEGLDAGFEL